MSCNGAGVMPMYPRSIVGLFESAASTSRATFDGTAKPRLLESECARVFIPTTLPFDRTSGPPLLPGFIAASVWSHVLKLPVSYPLFKMVPSKYLSVLDIIPRVTVLAYPCGVPTA